jgi:hypothetical protein
VFGIVRAPGATTGVEEEADTLYLLGVLPDYFASGEAGASVHGLVDYLTVTPNGPRWSADYAQRIIKRAEARLRELALPTADEARRRMLLSIEGLMQRCWNYRIGTAPSGGAGEGEGGGGSAIIDDPDTGKPLREIDHAAIQGYLKLAMKLMGLDVQRHEHRNIGERPFSELTDADLQKLADEEERARSARPVESTIS